MPQLVALSKRMKTAVARMKALAAANGDSPLRQSAPATPTKESSSTPTKENSSSADSSSAGGRRVRASLVFSAPAASGGGGDTAQQHSESQQRQSENQQEKQSEAEPQDDAATAIEPVSGYMMKQGDKGVIKSWKKRWCVNSLCRMWAACGPQWDTLAHRSLAHCPP